MRLHAQSDQQQDQQRLLRTSSQYLDQASQTAASWRSQALGTLRESVLLTYTTLVESVLVTLADVSRLSTFLNWLTPRLESGIGRLNGEPKLDVVTLLQAVKSVLDLSLGAAV